MARKQSGKSLSEEQTSSKQISMKRNHITDSIRLKLSAHFCVIICCCYVRSNGRMFSLRFTVLALRLQEHNFSFILGFRARCGRR